MVKTLSIRVKNPLRRQDRSIKCIDCYDNSESSFRRDERNYSIIERRVFFLSGDCF